MELQSLPRADAFLLHKQRCLCIELDMSSKYTIRDESPFADTPMSRELMKKACKDVTIEGFFEAQEEAYRRSFINSSIASALYAEDGAFVGTLS